MLKPLLGFSDFFDEVGAVKPPGGKPVQSKTARTAPGKPTKTAPGKGLQAGRVPVRKAQRTSKVSPHKASLKTAATVAVKAKKTSNKIATRLKKEATRARVVVGAVKKMPRTAKQKAAQAKFARAQGKVIALLKKAKPVGDKVAQKAEALRVSLSKAQPIVAKLFAAPKVVPGPKGAVQRAAVVKPTPRAVPRSVQRAVVGEDEYTDTDALFTDDTMFTEETYDPSAPPVCVLPTEVDLPTRGQPLSPEDALVVFSFLPDDAVVYDGVARGIPEQSLGSWGLFYGEKTKLKSILDQISPEFDSLSSGNSLKPKWANFVNTYRNTDIAPGFLWGKVSGHETQGYTFLYRNAYDFGQWRTAILNAIHGRNGGKDFLRMISWQLPETLAGSQEIARNSNERGWGPLIGNPSGPLAGLQYDASSNTWFWQAEKAPRWYGVVAQADQEVKRLNKDARDTAQATCDADRVAWEAWRAEMERDRAQREYEMEMATEEAITTQTIEQARVVTAQQQAQQQQEAAQMQFEQQQQQAELQYAQQQGQLEQQQAQMNLAQQQQMADLQKQIVEEIMATPEEELEAADAEASAEAVEPSYEDTASYSEPEAESDKFRHPLQDDDDYEASGFEDDGEVIEEDGGFDDSGEDLEF